MALQQRLDIRQAQSLVMTPQLQQAIKLLQLSSLELAEYVESELERNPLLERDESEGWSDAPADGVDREEPIGLEPPTTRADALDLAASDRLTPAADAPLDTDFENVYTNSSVGDLESAGLGSGEQFGEWSSRQGGFDEDENGFEARMSERPKLRDFLEQQIVMDLPDRLDRMIAYALMDHLDGAGYFTGHLEDIASQLGVDEGRVERVFRAVQGFDPSGIFARTLSECLALQLKERNRLDPCMQALLDNLPLLAARNLNQLLKVCNVDHDDLTDMVAEIKQLNPKPAMAFDFEPVQTVTPDVIMRPAPDGSWLIDLNADNLPKILVNQRYHAKVSGGVRSKTDKDYIAECYQSASWLVKSLHQRATTILKVASEIVRQQDAFFRHGLQFMRPLILKDIADVIGMHESTVSRVTSNKYLASPRGLFELKYFFTAAIQGADGQAAHSAEAVRYRIKALIDAEKPDDTLSDDKIVEILREEGIDIARRTVAKYREGMKISSSVQRRREKALGL
jgi:RNA polymerase sigma-54 factor